MTYQLTIADSIFRIEDSTWIPLDPANRDYREYLDWVAAGNTPLPAPEPAPMPPALTPTERLEAAGLTVAELKQLLGVA